MEFRFDDSIVIREPVGEGNGYWVGAPGAYYDANEDRFLLAYRIRRPRGVEPDRGGETRIAVSKDGIEFEDVWTCTKDQLDSTSIERCMPIRTADGQLAHYISYVDPADNRWRIDRIIADSIGNLDVTRREKVFTAADVDLEGVKDPWIVKHGDEYKMLISVAYQSTDASANELHGTADAYNTGLIKSATALATSADGVNWEWQAMIMTPPDDGWDCYAARIGCAIWRPPVWIGYYDGSASVAENYEERLGLCASTDLKTWTSFTPDGPYRVSPHATGGFRYISVVEAKGELFWYFEAARADGSHDLRVWTGDSV